jgi:segregation and condensation protein B
MPPPVPSAKVLRHAVADLNRQYEAAQRSFRIEQVAGGYQMLTLPAYGPVLNKLHQREIDTKLSRSALETLAIIAYKQPVLRADVEAIRGVASGETIRNLMEKHLVKIAGRAEIPGRPILYGTTKRFLELFGLNSLKELPQQESPKPSAKPTDSKPEPIATAPTQEEAAPAEAVEKVAVAPEA